MSALELKRAALRALASAHRAKAEALDAEADELSSEGNVLSSRDPSPTSSLLDGRALAAHLGISLATVNRLRGEGMPHSIVGTRARYEADACRTWLASRGRKPTVAERADSIDVTNIARAAGFAVSRLR